MTQSEQKNKLGTFFLAKLPEKLFDVSCLRHNTPANAQVLYKRLCFALKSEFLISKKHLKPHDERNRDNLFNVINYILANQVTLYYRAGFPKLCAVKGIKVCREIFVFLIESHRVNCGYWVRRMRQLARASLENTAYSFILLYMFFRDHHDFGRKIAKYEIKSK